MSKGIDWASAPEGYPIWVESKLSCEPSGWHCLDEKGNFRDGNGEIWQPWQVAAGECIPHYKPEWDGDGLPPAGKVCEYSVVDDGPWFVCTVKYIVTPMADEPIQVVIHCPHLNGEQVAFPGNSIGEIQFRPIRTAEQIAADERLHQIRHACSAISQATESYNLNINCSAAMRAVVEAMIDEGYRKQVAP